MLYKNNQEICLRHIFLLSVPQSLQLKFSSNRIVFTKNEIAKLNNLSDHVIGSLPGVFESCNLIFYQFD